MRAVAPILDPSSSKMDAPGAAGGHRVRAWSGGDAYWAEGVDPGAGSIVRRTPSKSRHYRHPQFFVRGTFQKNFFIRRENSGILDARFPGIMVRQFLLIRS